MHAAHELQQCMALIFEDQGIKEKGSVDE